MANKYTKFTGYLRRYDGDEGQILHRIAVSKSMSRGGFLHRRLFNGSSDISIMPPGLNKATSFYLEVNATLNVTLYSDSNAASMDIFNVLYMNGSLSDVKIRNNNSASMDVIYDLIG